MSRLIPPLVISFKSTHQLSPHSEQIIGPLCIEGSSKRLCEKRRDGGEDKQHVTEVLQRLRVSARAASDLVNFFLGPACVPTNRWGLNGPLTPVARVS